MSLSRSPSARAWRRLMPVRTSIHSSSTPRRSAMGAFSTTVAGTASAAEPTAAPRSSRPARSGARLGASSRTCGLLQRSRVGAVDDAANQAGEHLAWADLDEALLAGALHRQHGLAPA